MSTRMLPSNEELLDLLSKQESVMNAFVEQLAMSQEIIDGLHLKLNNAEQCTTNMSTALQQAMEQVEVERRKNMELDERLREQNMTMESEMMTLKEKLNRLESQESQATRVLTEADSHMEQLKTLNEQLKLTVDEREELRIRLDHELRNATHQRREIDSLKRCLDEQRKANESELSKMAMELTEKADQLHLAESTQNILKTRLEEMERKQIAEQKQHKKTIEQLHVDAQLVHSTQRAEIVQLRDEEQKLSLRLASMNAQKEIDEQNVDQLLDDQRHLIYALQLECSALVDRLRRKLEDEEEEEAG